jgi:carbamate kinase
MIARPFSGDAAPGTIVIALGGNALMPHGEQGDIHQQFAHTRESLTPIVALAKAGWRIAVVHGNGPQIGVELLRNEMARGKLPPLPLGVLVAGTQGWIGYMIQQSLQNALERAGVDRQVVTIVTQVIVDPDDPAYDEPTKPIGRAMQERTARALERDVGWAVGPSEGGWRRLVPSPRPIGIVERAQIRQLVEEGNIVIAAGGGGIPVYRHPVLMLEGIDAVIDKDRAAEVLARDITADSLLILSNIDGVFADFGTPIQRLIRNMSAAEAERMLESGTLGKGSMGPKVEAALAFVRGGGKRALIGKLERGSDVVEGRTGTLITEN